VTILPDTSIWVRYFRTGNDAASAELDRLLAEKSVVGCGPVLAELLTGTAAKQRDALWLAVGTTGWAGLDREAWRRVGEVAGDLRSRGLSVPLTDVAIAVSAVRADAALWSDDSDFDRVGEVLPELERYRPG